MLDWFRNTPLVLTIKCHTLKSAPSEKVDLKKKRIPTYRKSRPYATIHCIGSKTSI